MGEYNSHHINGLRSKLRCQEWRRVKGDQEAGKADLVYQHIGHWVGRFWQTLRHTGWTHVGASTEATGRHKQVFTGYLESWRMKGKTRASDPKAIFIQNRTQKWHIARVIQEVISPTANFCSFLDTSYQPLLDDSWSPDVRCQPWFSKCLLPDIYVGTMFSKHKLAHAVLCPL